MKKINLLVIAIAIASLVMSQTASSELISASGDSYTSTSYQLDWSIGELQTMAYIGTTSTLTQGFHQGTYEISTHLENPLWNYNIIAYPNPTTDFIKVEWNNISLNGGHGSVLVLTDINGKVLQNAKILSPLQSFDFSNYATGMYFITISQNNQIIKSFKIIKK